MHKIAEQGARKLLEVTSTVRYVVAILPVRTSTRLQRCDIDMA